MYNMNTVRKKVFWMWIWTPGLYYVSGTRVVISISIVLNGNKRRCVAVICECLGEVGAKGKQRVIQRLEMV